MDRCRTIVTYISHDRYMRIDAMRYRPRSIQTNLFLHTIDDIETKIELITLIMDLLGNLSNHISAYTVVQCSTNIVAVVQHHKIRVEGCYGPYMDTKCFDFVSTRRSHIDGEIFHLRDKIFAITTTSMYRWSAKYSLDSTSIIFPEIDSHTRRNLIIRSTIAYDVDISLVIDIIDESRNLISMSLYHNLILRIRIDNSYCCPIVIDKVLIDIVLEIVQPYFLTFFFISSGSMSIEIFFEEGKICHYTICYKINKCCYTEIYNLILN